MAELLHAGMPVLQNVSFWLSAAWLRKGALQQLDQLLPAGGAWAANHWEQWARCVFVRTEAGAEKPPAVWW